MWRCKTIAAPHLFVDRVVSLGALCEVAYQARRLSRSSRAYPFDWWDTPFVGLLRVLNAGAPAVFSPSHITKVPIKMGALPAFYSRFSDTVHQHEFARDDDLYALDEAEISRRLVPKYVALHARLVGDCADGVTLFVRQRKPNHDPEGAALSVMTEELHIALSAFAADFRILLIDYDPIDARPWLMQAHVQRHSDWTDLGSERGWDEMFRSLGIICRSSEGAFGFDDLSRTFARPSSLLGRLRHFWERRQELRRRRNTR